MEEVTLRCGDAAAVVTGGDLLGLTSWSVDGRELLAAPEDLRAAYRVHGRRAGVTLLHPWANRVGADRFAVVGHEVVVAHDDTASFDPAGLPIHGLAAPGAWDIEPEGGQSLQSRVPGTTACVARRRCPPVAAFPFDHEIEVVVRLGEARVDVVTTVCAGDAGPLPVAFGWHPYFVAPGAREEWELRLPIRTHMALDEDGLPTGRLALEEAEDAPLGTRRFDDAYLTEPGTRWSVGPVTVSLGDGYEVAQVFAPDDGAVVSLEPMTAPPDALRSGDGLRVLEPGERFSARFAMTYAR